MFSIVCRGFRFVRCFFLFYWISNGQSKLNCTRANDCSHTPHSCLILCYTCNESNAKLFHFIRLMPSNVFAADAVSNEFFSIPNYGINNNNGFQWIYSLLLVLGVEWCLDRSNRKPQRLPKPRSWIFRIRIRNTKPRSVLIYSELNWKWKMLMRIKRPPNCNNRY